MATPKEPLVSVIMNCFNGEEFLREAIDSVYAQTYLNWEIIFWDNASTDSSAAIAQSYDEKLNYYRSEETTILGEARVKATRMAKGKYIAFLDSDDVWLEEKLEKQVFMFNENHDQLGFVYCRTKVIFDDGSREEYVHKKSQILPQGNIFNELAKENFVMFSSVMVDRDKFYLCGGFPMHFLNSTDYYVFLRLARRYQCMAIQEVCSKCRVHEGNLSAQQRIIGAEETIGALRDFLPDERLRPALRIQYTNLAIMHFREKNISLAILILIRHGNLFHFCVRLYDALVNVRRYW